MRLYLDDDSADPVLLRLLQQAGHDVRLPNDVGLRGADDPVHLTKAIAENRGLLSRNHRDFLQLHALVMQAGGHHPGLLIVRRDNDPTRDLTSRGIVRAIAKAQRLPTLAVTAEGSAACHAILRLPTRSRSESSRRS